MNVNDKTLVESFKAIGFNEYGAKAYIYLHRHNRPLTAYELGKIASVPRSKIYEVMDQLLEKQIVVQTNSKPKKYMASGYEAVLSKLRSDYMARVDRIHNDLAKMTNGQSIDFVVNLINKDSILEKAIELIRASRKSILAAMCPGMLQLLDEELKRAENRSVEIHLICYSNLETGYKNTYTHLLNQPNIEEYLFLLLDRDFEEGLAGSMDKLSGQGHGIWTENAWLRNIMQDNIIHEIYLGMLEEKLGLHQIAKLTGEIPARLWARANEKFSRNSRATIVNPRL